MMKVGLEKVATEGGLDGCPSARRLRLDRQLRAEHCLRASRARAWRKAEGAERELQVLKDQLVSEAVVEA